MKLLTPQDVSLRHGDHIYRESSILHLFAAVGSLGAAIWILSLYRRGDAPLFIAIVSGGGLVLFSLFFFHIFRKSLSGNNWYVAVRTDGVLLIRFRSHLNELLPTEDVQIASLQLDEIDSAGVTKQLQKSDAHRGTRFQFFTFLDIHTTCDNLDHLEERLAHEIRVKAKTKYHVHPLSVDGRTLRIQWRSAAFRLAPGIANIVTNLNKQGVKMLPTKRERVDLRAAAVQSRKTQEADIIRMVQAGDRISAVRLARKLYDFDLTEAAELVDQLAENEPE